MRMLISCAANDRRSSSLQLRQSLAQSELQMLRAQLHPHFLFNTLQGVSTLIDTDRATAQNMLLTLAGLLRKVLKYGSTDLLPFREELAFVEAYLQLERMRLGRRLEVRWQIAPEVAAALIPQFCCSRSSRMRWYTASPPPGTAAGSKSRHACSRCNCWSRSATASAAPRNPARGGHRQHQGAAEISLRHGCQLRFRGFGRECRRGPPRGASIYYGPGASGQCIGASLCADSDSRR